MKTFTKTRTGVVCTYDGAYWGVQYQDGRCTEYGYGSIEEAELSDPEFCKKPTDKTYKGSPYEKALAKGKLVSVRITTIYEVDD